MDNEQRKQFWATCKKIVNPPDFNQEYKAKAGTSAEITFLPSTIGSPVRIRIKSKILKKQATVPARHKLGDRKVSKDYETVSEIIKAENIILLLL